MTLRLAAALALFVVPVSAKTIERQLRWDQLSAELAGQRVEVDLVSKGRVNGRLLRVEDAGLIVQSRRGEQLVPRQDIFLIETRRRKGPKWSLIGAGIGVGATLPLLVVADILRKNEGGVNSGKVEAAAAGIVAAAGIAGYFAGRAADVDRVLIRIPPQ